MSSRDAKGRFQRGQSGNPRGRPTGVGAAAELRAAITAFAPGLVQVLAKAAVAGDVAAARALLAYVLPPLRPVDAPVEIEAGGSTLTDRALATVEAMQAGYIAPEAARLAVATMADAARLRELDQLELRIAKLEAAQKKLQS